MVASPLLTAPVATRLSQHLCMSHTYVVSPIWVALLLSPLCAGDSGRKPWDILRFVKTVAYFNDPPTPDKFFANLAKQLLPQQQVHTGISYGRTSSYLTSCCHSRPFRRVCLSPCSVQQQYPRA